MNFVDGISLIGNLTTTRPPCAARQDYEFKQQYQNLESLIRVIISSIWLCRLGEEFL